VDVTNDWSKSISLAHASIRQNLYHAKLTGDPRGVEYWSAREARFSEALQRANAAGMAYLQEHAGYTRTGQHSRKNGRDTGRFKEADLVIGSFLQSTNRDGEMHDHEHNLVWSKVFTRDDGKVRALDTMSLRSQLPAIQAVIAATTKSELTREFGFKWADRPDGKGREIKGVTREEIDQFSARSQIVDTDMRERVAEWERKHGYEADEATVRHQHDKAWYETRKGKKQETLDWDAHSRKWERVSGGRWRLSSRVWPVRHAGPEAGPVPGSSGRRWLRHWPGSRRSQPPSPGRS
jgi:conjugative relaxase-like TrwC/TraI family protein